MIAQNLLNAAWPPLSALIVVPAVGALACLAPIFSSRFDPKGRLCRVWAIAVSLLTLVILASVAGAATGEPGAVLGVEEARQWIPSLGITYNLELDGLSFAFCLLTAVISLAVIAWSAKPASAGSGWYALLLLGEATVMGAFLATDLVLFYIFFEAMLLPVIGAMALWGGAQRLNAALKFLVYTMVGSSLMFLSILYLGWHAQSMGHMLGGNFAFEITTLASLKMLNPTEELVLGLAFLFAFAIKIPMVPFHGWLPDTYREAPHGVAAFTAALLGKVGIYAIIRFMWPLFPHFMLQAGPYLAAAGAVAIVFGALVAMAQKDLRSLLAYSSISHLGFCVLGLAGISTMAMTGAVFQAVSHGLVTAALFLTVGAIIDRQGSRDFDRLGGLARSIPLTAFFLMVFCVAGVALPLTSSFVGEFLILVGSWKLFPEWTTVALLGVVLGAVYTLTAYLKTMFGPLRASDPASGEDLRGFDVVILAALAGAILALGIFPEKLLDVISPAVQVNAAGAVVAENTSSHAV
jgi:NADH-quinone oxidoreductase subunit M